MFKVREDKNLKAPTQTAKPQFKNFHGGWKEASEPWINSEPGKKTESRIPCELLITPSTEESKHRELATWDFKPPSTGQTQRRLLAGWKKKKNYKKIF